MVKQPANFLEKITQRDGDRNEGSISGLFDGNHMSLSAGTEKSPSEYSKGTLLCKSLHIEDCMIAGRVKGMKELSLQDHMD